TEGEKTGKTGKEEGGKEEGGKEKGGKVGGKEEEEGDEVRDPVVQRDETYFSADPAAGVFVRIGDVMFKVRRPFPLHIIFKSTRLTSLRVHEQIHEQLLSCCTFMVDQHERHVQEHGPTTEGRPLLFESAGVDEWRAFLWALYASTDTLSAPPETFDPTHISRLLLLLSLTQKYYIPRLHTWVLTTLHATAHSSVYMESCSSASLTSLLEAFLAYSLQLAGHERGRGRAYRGWEYHHRRPYPLSPASLEAQSEADDEKAHLALTHAAIQAITATWRKRLETKSAPSVPAILAVDRWVDGGADGQGLKLAQGVLECLKSLKGVAYYVHVQDMIDRQGGVGGGGLVHDDAGDRDRKGGGGGVTMRGALPLRADPKLSNGQVMRLLAGYFSLVSLWERLRLHPLPIPLPSASSSSSSSTPLSTSTSTSTPLSSSTNGPSNGTSTPRSSPSSSICTPAHHASKCIPTWERRWTHACGWRRIMGHSSADILGLLECLRDQLAGDEELKCAGAGGAGVGASYGASTTNGGSGGAKGVNGMKSAMNGGGTGNGGGQGIHPECRLAGLRAIRELRERTKEGLADHFYAVV
ncbi:hypothetical protein CVT26_002293, partial [Gymnopilus dilepis]